MEEADADESPTAEAAFARRGCCFFWVAPNWERIHGGDHNPSAAAAAGSGRWWRAPARALMKVREWSELVAGPRWKTFIRRIGRRPRFGQTRLNYDPLSYALNFEEPNGAGSPDSAELGGTGYRDFSARFVMPPSGKSSMDLGAAKNAPSPFGAAAGH